MLHRSACKHGEQTQRTIKPWFYAVRCLRVAANNVLAALKLISRDSQLPLAVNVFIVYTLSSRSRETPEWQYLKHGLGSTSDVILRLSGGTSLELVCVHAYNGSIPLRG